MSIFKQPMSRRGFLKHAGSHILTVAALTNLQPTSMQNTVLAEAPTYLYGTSSYGSLTYGQPLESDELLSLSPDSQIFLPIITKEAK